MKREILCNKCEPTYHHLFPVESSDPGEYVKFMKGKAKKNMSCDFCGFTIKKNKSCCAFSIYTDSRPYIKWEDDYIYNSDKE